MLPTNPLHNLGGKSKHLPDEDSTQEPVGSIALPQYASLSACTHWPNWTMHQQSWVEAAKYK